MSMTKEQFELLLADAERRSLELKERTRLGVTKRDQQEREAIRSIAIYLEEMLNEQE